MMRFLGMILMYGLCLSAFAQDFEVNAIQDTYLGTINQTIKAPLRFKNTSDKTITLIIKKLESQIGTSQKNYYCLDGKCLGEKVRDFSLRIEPGGTINGLDIALEAGLAPGISTIKYSIYNKSNPRDVEEVELNFVVEEETEKSNIYSSAHIKLKDVYPNPVRDVAFVEYSVLKDQVKAKIVIHNVLGSSVKEFELPNYENKVKFNTLNLNSGVYFYTLYIDETAVMSRKLIVETY